MSYEQALCAWPSCSCSFTRKVADRKRGWAKCCSKSCAAKLRTFVSRKQNYHAAKRHPQNDYLPTTPKGPEFEFED